MILKKTTREYTEYEKKLRRYYMLGFISEFSKICIFLVFFAFLGLVPEYLIALVAMFSLRGIGGGLHFNHYVTCLVVSFAFVCGSVFLALYIMPQPIIIYSSMLLCALLGYLLVPITSKNRPPATLEQIKKCKRNTTIVILFYFILLCFCPDATWSLICYWTVILHIGQLVVAYIMNRR